MTPGHDQTVPATSDRARARTAVGRRGAEARQARPSVRTLDVIWSVGRRALAASRPELGIRTGRASVCVELRMRITVSGETAEITTLELLDGDWRYALDVPTQTGLAIADGSSGLLHVDMASLKATFSTRTGRPVFISTGLPGELLGLAGGRYELARVS